MPYRPHFVFEVDWGNNSFGTGSIAYPYARASVRYGTEQGVDALPIPARGGVIVPNDDGALDYASASPTLEQRLTPHRARIRQVDSPPILRNIWEGWAQLNTSSFAVAKQASFSLHSALEYRAALEFTHTVVKGSAGANMEALFTALTDGVGLSRYGGSDYPTVNLCHVFLDRLEALPLLRRMSPMMNGWIYETHDGSIGVRTHALASDSARALPADVPLRFTVNALGASGNTLDVSPPTFTWRGTTYTWQRISIGADAGDGERSLTTLDWSPDDGKVLREFREGWRFRWGSGNNYLDTGVAPSEPKDGSVGFYGIPHAGRNPQRDRLRWFTQRVGSTVPTGAFEASLEPIGLDAFSTVPLDGNPAIDIGEGTDWGIFPNRVVNSMRASEAVPQYGSVTIERSYPAVLQPSGSITVLVDWSEVGSVRYTFNGLSYTSHLGNEQTYTAAEVAAIAIVTQQEVPHPRGPLHSGWRTQTTVTLNPGNTWRGTPRAGSVVMRFTATQSSAFPTGTSGSVVSATPYTPQSPGASPLALRSQALFGTREDTRPSWQVVADAGYLQTEVNRLAEPKPVYHVVVPLWTERNIAVRLSHIEVGDRAMLLIPALGIGDDSTSPPTLAKGVVLAIEFSDSDGGVPALAFTVEGL